MLGFPINIQDAFINLDGSSYFDCFFIFTICERKNEKKGIQDLSFIIPAFIFFFLANQKTKKMSNE